MHTGDYKEPINRDAVTFTISITSDVLAGVQAVLEAALAHSSGKVSMELSWPEAAASCSHDAVLTTQHEPFAAGNMQEGGHFGNQAMAWPPGSLAGAKSKQQAACAIAEGAELRGEDQEDEEMLSEGAVDDLASIAEQMGLGTGATPS